MALIDPIPAGNVTSRRRESSQQSSSRSDPLLTFRFHIEMAGVIEAGFIECTGLGMERKVFQYKEGGVNDYAHQLPERVEYPRITLRRGMTSSNELWKWCVAGKHNGQIERKNISIVLLDANGEEVKRWNLAGAYPVKWTAPQFKADGNEVAIEALEIVHHGLALDDGETTS